MMKRLSTLVPLATLLGLSAFAGNAAADPGPTPPDNLTGAAHMVNEHAFPGMTNAMTVNMKNNENGNVGMWCAVYITAGSPDSCTRD